MSYFKDAADVYDHIGKIFEIALADPELAPKFEAVGACVRLDCTDPESTITVDFATRKVEYGSDGSLAPDVALKMSADVAHRFWLGKLNVAMALARKQIEPKGDIQRVLKVVPLTKPINATYTKLLTERGRTDLLAVD